LLHANISHVSHAKVTLTMALKGHWLDDGSVFLLQASNTLDDMLNLNILPRILLLSLLGVFITLSSCDKEEDPTGPADASVIYFSGQTGETNGIVAQVADPDQGTTTSVYGTYDATGAPATITSFRVARAGTDTVVTLVIDPDHQQLRPRHLRAQRPAAQLPHHLRFSNGRYQHGAQPLRLRLGHGRA
jgi:hypothetical protein